MKNVLVQRLERWWWQLFWQLRHQCMPWEVTAGSRRIAAGHAVKHAKPQVDVKGGHAGSMLAAEAVDHGARPRADARDARPPQIVDARIQP